MDNIDANKAKILREMSDKELHDEIMADMSQQLMNTSHSDLLQYVIRIRIREAGNRMVEEADLANQAAADELKRMFGWS